MYFKTYHNFPQTTYNFAALCKGTHKLPDGRPMTYVGTKVYSNTKGKRFMAGDVTNNDGTGGWTVYGRYQKDEKIDDSSHQQSYQIGMVHPSKSERNKSDSKFYITYDTMNELNQWNTLFGNIVDGHHVLDMIEEAGSEDGTPAQEVVITGCDISTDHTFTALFDWMNMHY